VFDDQQLVRDLALLTFLDQSALKFERLGIARTPEIPHFALKH
jgi:hypothetical protein